MHKTRKISSFELHDNTLLHETVDHNDTTKLQQLMPFVKNKVYNINYPDLDWNDQTPLHIACANGYRECCKILLENGANKDVKMSHGKTPAHYAAENGHLEVLQLLFYFGANLYETDNSGETPLQLATKYKHLDCAEFIRELETFEDIMKEEEQKFFQSILKISFLEQQNEYEETADTVS